MNQISKKTFVPSHLEDKDRKLLWDLSLQRFRYLTAGIMARLRATPPDEIHARLERLADQGFVRRLYLPDITRPHPGEPIYTLSPKGARFLAHLTHLRPNRLYQPVRKSNFLFLEHALLINEVRIALTAALRTRPDFHLIFWRDERRLRAARRKLPRLASDKARAAPLPDALFGLEGNDARRFFALEVDRGSMSLQAMRRKWEGYLDLRRSRLYELYFGVRDFQVLVLTTTSRRKTRLAEDLAAQASETTFIRFLGLAELREGKEISPERLLAALLGGFPSA